ncbi:hypothetical protein XFLAVUS301_21240 [Xanthobacter flavus]|uniref:Uncharacterized protein n=1 Tax=Xanthobacter flavus TaxID=281 RepID=A0A9W6CL87_XANFL|nr:hypothetical protein XFLAVUS301_21240 [Xanthobacter flavus]
MAAGLRPWDPVWSAVPEASGPLVFVHYMHCYVAGSFTEATPQVAQYETFYGRGLPAPISVESQWFSIEDMQAGTGGIEATRREFDLMERNGINAAGLLIGPGHLPRSKFAEPLRMVLAAASTSPVKVIPELWFDADKVNAAAYGRDVANVLKVFPDALQRYQGKPLFLVSHQTPTVDRGLRPPRAAALLDDLFAEWGGRAGVFLVVNTAGGAKHIDGFARFADALGCWVPPGDWSGRSTRTFVELAEAERMKAVFPVASGFYQRRAGLVPWEYANAFGAARFIDAWNEVIARKSQFVEIQTWNDFSEDSAVVPTNSHGTAFLDLARYFIGRLRGAGELSFGQETAMIFHPRQTTRALLDDPAATVRQYKWRNIVPTVDYVDVVTLLTAPAQVKLSIGSASFAMDVGAGLSEWIIIAEPPIVRPKGDEVAAQPGSFPVSGGFRTVTRVEKIDAAMPRVEVVRDGRAVVELTSRSAIQDRGPYQDLTVIATKAEAMARRL